MPASTSLLCYLTGKTRSDKLDLFIFVHAPSRGVQVPESGGDLDAHIAIGGQTIVVSAILPFLLPPC